MYEQLSLLIIGIHILKAYYAFVSFSSLSFKDKPFISPSFRWFNFLLLLPLLVLSLNSSESLFDTIEDCVGNGRVADDERILVCSIISFLSLYTSSITPVVHKDLQCYYAKNIQINED